jgi:hypothetical protein
MIMREITMIKSMLSAATAALLVSGCATVQTTPGSSGEGIAYNLPKTQFVLTLARNGGNIVVAVVAPVGVPDPYSAMITSLPISVISNNEFNVTISDRNLLATAQGYSDGQLATLLENAIKSAINIQGGGDGGSIEFFQGKYDFSEFEQAMIDGNTAIRSMIETNCPGNRSLAGDEASNKACAQLKALVGSVSGNFFKLEVMTGTSRLSQTTFNPRVAGFQDEAQRIEQLGNCPKDALCYHPLVPVTLTLSVPGHFSKSDSYLIADKTKIAYVKPRGGVFAKQEYSYTFTQGQLTGYKQTSRSELVGLAALPLTIVKSIISAPAEALAAKTSVTDAETKYLDSQQKNADSRKKLGDTCEADPRLCSSSTTRILGSTTGSSEPATGNTGGGGSLGNDDD